MNIIKTIQNRIYYLNLSRKGKANKGYCSCCESNTWFVEEGIWLRDFYKCAICGSIPRFRLLIHVLNLYFKDWEKLSIHESSPGGMSSNLIKKKCVNYSSSHYFEEISRGQMKGEHRSEDLSAMTFDDNYFDLFITQDVFEHVIDPVNAFKEIARVLKPGGAHVFTMPWYPELKNSRQRAKLENGKIINIEEPVYHGNPISYGKSLVTFDWGIDFPGFIFNKSGMSTIVIKIKDRSLGLDAEYLEVFISQKPFSNERP